MTKTGFPSEPVYMCSPAESEGYTSGMFCTFSESVPQYRETIARTRTADGVANESESKQWRPTVLTASAAKRELRLGPDQRWYAVDGAISHGNARPKGGWGGSWDDCSGGWSWSAMHDGPGGDGGADRWAGDCGACGGYGRGQGVAGLYGNLRQTGGWCGGRDDDCGSWSRSAGDDGSGGYGGTDTCAGDCGAGSDYGWGQGVGDANDPWAAAVADPWARVAATPITSTTPVTRTTPAPSRCGQIQTLSFTPSNEQALVTPPRPTLGLQTLAWHVQPGRVTKQWGPTVLTAHAAKKELRPGPDRRLYTVDEFTGFYGARKGLIYWSWNYYLQDLKTVEVERVDSEGVPVTLPTVEVSDEDWHKWLSAVPTKSPLDIQDIHDGWILDAAAVDALKRVGGHLYLDDEDRSASPTLALNKVPCGPAGLLERWSFDDEELVLMTLSGNLAHRIIRLGVEHPHLLKGRDTNRRRLVSWMFSSGMLTGKEDRAGRPQWAGGAYAFLSRSHLRSINWTNPEAVDSLLDGEKLQSKHILCSGSMLGILDLALNEDVDPGLIVNGRERFQMTRAGHVSAAKVINLRIATGR